MNVTEKNIILDTAKQEQYEFANDYSFKARIISCIFLALLFVLIKTSIHESLPLMQLLALLVFEGLINQPYSFVRKSIKSLVHVLWINTTIDILAITFIMFNLGGTTVPFAPFIFFIPLLLSSAISGPLHAYWLSTLSTLAFIIMGILEHYFFIPHLSELAAPMTMSEKAARIGVISSFFYLLSFLFSIPFMKFKKDIRERILREEELRESKEKYRSVVDNIGIGVSLISSKMEIIALNKQMKKWFPHADASQKLRCYNGFNSPPRDKICSYCPTYKTLKDGQLHESITQTLLNGERKDYRILSSPVKDSQGNITAAIEMVEDITDRKRAEEEIRDQKELLTHIISHIPHFVFWKSGDLRYLGCNENFAYTAGFTSPEDIIGKTDYNLPWKKEQADFFRRSDREVIKRGMPLLNIEEKQLQANGREATLLTSKVPLCNEGKEVIGVLGIYADITDIKRIEKELTEAKEKAEAASKIKSEILANISHEIRTSMNGILGMTELALNTQLSEQQLDYLKIIKESSDSLIKLIDEMPDFSNIETGQLNLECHKFSLRTNLYNTMKGFYHRIQRKRLKFKYHIDPNIIDSLIGDSRRMRQIIVHLVDNAVKFTEQGQIGVKVIKVQQTDSKVCLQFTVSDTGIGIPINKQRMIFDNFTQLDGSLSRQYGGTGIGLAMVKQLVEMMNGRIWVESELDRGSLFHFTLHFTLPKIHVLVTAEGKY